MPRKKTFTGTQFEGRELCNSPHQFSKEYLRTAVDMVATMQERHSKILVARMDLRYPQGVKADGSNRDFSSTMQASCREFSRKGYDPQYIAKREQKKSLNPHYHVALVVNGNKKKSIADLRSTLEKHWAHQLQLPLEEVKTKTLVYPCDKAPDGSPRANGRMIDRNKLEVIEKTRETIQQFSYLTKIDDDDQTPSKTKKFFSSQFYKDYNRTMEQRERWQGKKKEEEA